MHYCSRNSLVYCMDIFNHLTSGSGVQYESHTFPSWSKQLTVLLRIQNSIAIVSNMVWKQTIGDVYSNFHVAYCFANITLFTYFAWCSLLFRKPKQCSYCLPCIYVFSWDERRLADKYNCLINETNAYGYYLS